MDWKDLASTVAKSAPALGAALGGPAMTYICYWPDGTWCYRHELEQMSHMSDDFARAELPENLIEDEIHEFVQKEIK